MMLEKIDYDALFDLKLSTRDFAIFSYLIKCCNATTGQCYGKAKNLGSNFKLSDDTANAALRSLEDQGLIDCRRCRYGFSVTAFYLERGRKRKIEIPKKSASEKRETPNNSGTATEKSGCEIPRISGVQRKQRKGNVGKESVSNAHSCPSLGDCLSVANQMRRDGSSITDEFAEEFHSAMKEAGWITSWGMRITLDTGILRQQLATWWRKELQMKTEPPRSGKMMPPRLAQPEGVVLKQEGYDATRFD